MKNTIKQLFKNSYFYLFLILVGVFVFAYSTVDLDMLSDDGEYLRMIAEHPNYFNYISYTYQCLNGRIVANSLMFLLLQLNSLPLWGAISIFAIVSIAYHISCLFGKRASLKSMTVVLGLILCFGFRVLSSSMLWFTGAVFYLWPIAVLFYLLARLSNRFYAEQSTVFDWRYCLDVLLGSILMLWSEQAALVLLGFYAVSFVYHIFFKKRKPEPLAVIAFALWIVAFLVMFFAPSQRARMNNVYGYAALEGGIGYFLQNGIYWTFDAIFVQQRLLILLLGAVTLLCADRKKHQILLHAFEVIFPISVVALLIHGTSFSGYVDASKYIYSITYLAETGYTLANLIPYLYWLLYSVLLIAIILLNAKNKMLTALMMLASLATLVIMWFSTTMYASGYRTCAIFCLSVTAFSVKMLQESDRDCTPVIVGAGITNMMFFADFLSEHFIIFY